MSSGNGASSSSSVPQKATTYAKLLDNYLKENLPDVISTNALAERYRSLGATVEEAKDYLEQAYALSQKPLPAQPPARLPTPPGLDENAARKFRTDRDNGPLVSPNLAAIAPHFTQLEKAFTTNPHIALTNVTD
ncbi:hypothetical protein PQX77_007670 [Marasmius sp. AFHP31]|nr:hypothetical protein PQX77_007670 [Marasmius sp. AFHP31]